MTSYWSCMLFVVEAQPVAIGDVVEQLGIRRMAPGERGRQSLDQSVVVIDDVVDRFVGRGRARDPQPVVALLALHPGQAALADRRRAQLRRVLPAGLAEH